MIKIKTLEEFKETKRHTYFGYQETPDEFSHLLGCGVRVVCTWKDAYENYCELREKYIKKMTPIVEFFKEHKNQMFSIKELQEHFNNINSGSLMTLIRENVINKENRTKVVDGIIIQYVVFGLTDGKSLN